MAFASHCLDRFEGRLIHLIPKLFIVFVEQDLQNTVGSGIAARTMFIFAEPRILVALAKFAQSGAYCQTDS